MRYDRKKFTLIEMLVVISIIAILSSLLMPSLQSSLESGRKVVCANNFKLLNFGFQSYINDFNGYIVPPVNQNTTNRRLYTFAYHWDYYFGLNYLEQKWLSEKWDMFQCPSDDFERVSYKKKYRSYSVPLGLLGDLTSDEDVRITNRKIKPSRTLMCGENEMTKAKYENAYCGNASSNAEVVFWSGLYIGVPHNHTSNMLFIDGHVETGNLMTWFTPSYEGYGYPYIQHFTFDK